MLGQNVAREIYVTGLQNAHAMEKQALSIMRPQVERIEKYPEVARKLEEHIRETEGQLERLDTILRSHDSSPSALKDSFLSAFGGMASMGHAVAGDEIIKNALANSAFENYEIAAYLTLIGMARASGDEAAVPALEQSLEEERRMAAWLQDSMMELTQQFMRLKAGGDRAKS